MWSHESASSEAFELSVRSTQFGVLGRRRQSVASRMIRLLLCLAPVALLFTGSEGRADTLGVVKAAPVTPAIQEYQKGLSALNVKHLAAAEASFERSLQLDPAQVSSLLGLAEVNILRGNVAGADQYLRKASTLAPRDPNVLTMRGHYLFFRRNYAQAEHAFKAATALDPKLERPHYELGDLYLLGLHKPKEAIEAYKEALAINPNDSRVHYTLANALAEAGRMDDAEAQLEAASRLDPKNPALLDSVGEFYVRRGKFNQAQRAFGRALAVDPRFVPARMAEGDLFLIRKDPDQALSNYEAILQATPRSAAALVKIGIANEMKGRRNEAEQAYRKAIAIEPNDALALNNLAWIDIQRNVRLDEALSFAKRAIRAAPKIGQFLDTLGWAYHVRGDQTKAMETLKEATAVSPGDPEVHYHLGVALDAAGRKSEALAEINKSLSLKKGFPEAAEARKYRQELNRSPAR
jgi:tetratricopeptide (TPR) repeat protein